MTVDWRIGLNKEGFKALRRDESKDERKDSGNNEMLEMS